MTAPTRPADPEYDRAVKIAGVALHRAMAGDLPGAADYVKRLSGTVGLAVACKAWCDTYIGRIHGQDGYGKRIKMAYWDVTTGVLDEDGTSQPPARIWAGEMIAARCIGDEVRFVELLRRPSEGAELGDSIMALLHLVAESLKYLPHVATASGESS